MSAPEARVEAAQHPQPPTSQDRVFVLPHAVVVLDGASAPDPTARGGGWHAAVLGAEITGRLAGAATDSLHDVLAASIAAVVEEHALTPGSSPSSTVAVVRWDDEQVEALVLGDSPVVAVTRHGAVEVRDDRLSRVAVAERAAYREALRRGAGYGEPHRARMRRVVEEEQRHRNRHGGYWIAEADPIAATHAVFREWRRAEVRAVLAVTDGAAAAVDTYRPPTTWAEAHRLAANDGVQALIARGQTAEEGDPDGVRWPRSKPHDDKTAVLITF